jgi:hypothetical protein
MKTTLSPKSFQAKKSVKGSLVHKILMAMLMLVALFGAVPMQSVFAAPSDGRRTPALAPGRRTPALAPGRKTPALAPGRRTPALAPGRRTPALAHQAVCRTAFTIGTIRIPGIGCIMNIIRQILSGWAFNLAN